MDKKLFWDNKILNWEFDKYDKINFIDFNKSLKLRMKVAENYLNQIGQNKIILELGCGSSRLLPALCKINFKKYIGLDFSELAINEAVKKSLDLNIRSKCEFYNCSITENSFPKVDICYSLGLLDWLEIGEIKKVINNYPCEYLFHSFSRNESKIIKSIHKFYVYFMYGYKNNGYVPKYYSQQQIFNLFSESFEHINFVHTKQLGLVNFVRNFNDCY